MKVLLVSLFHPELVRGGAQQVAYELFEGLKVRPGVAPTLLCGVDSMAPALFKSGARITGFDGREGEYVFLSRNYDYRWHRVADPALAEAFVEFLALLRPDVVHFHHFLLFGFEFFTLARKTLPEARIVLTLHEFLTICDANGHMVRKRDGSLCDRPSSVRCHQCFPDRGPEEFFTRELWVKRHLASIDAFTTPTLFMIDRFAAWGLKRERLFHVANGQRDYSEGGLAAETRAKRNRFGFFGQLIDAKGVLVILRAVDQLRVEGFVDFVVELNGDNLNFASPECRKEIEDFLAREASQPFARRNVRFNGAYTVDQLGQRMARVDWCVVASVWWEAFALVISEAWMFGRPVIASNVGAMAERVRHEVDGLLFTMGDPTALAQTMRRAASEPNLWSRLTSGVNPPPSREDMVEGFLPIYEGKTATARVEAPQRRINPLRMPAPSAAVPAQEIRFGAGN